MSDGILILSLEIYLFIFLSEISLCTISFYFCSFIPCLRKIYDIFSSISALKLSEFNILFKKYKEFKKKGLQTRFLMVVYYLSSGSGGMADALDSGSSGSFILWEFKSPLPH